MRNKKPTARAEIAKMVISATERKKVRIPYINDRWRATNDRFAQSTA